MGTGYETPFYSSPLWKYAFVPVEELIFLLHNGPVVSTLYANVLGGLGFCGLSQSRHDASFF